MQSTHIKIQREIWKQRRKKIKTFFILLLVTIVFCVVFLLPQLTTGEWEEVPAYVENVGFSHGSNGGSVYLVCRLPNGNVVNVFIYDNQMVGIGDQVMLRADKRIVRLGEDKYSFLGISDQ